MHLRFPMTYCTDLTGLFSHSPSNFSQPGSQSLHKTGSSGSQSHVVFWSFSVKFDSGCFASPVRCLRASTQLLAANPQERRFQGGPACEVSEGPWPAGGWQGIRFGVREEFRSFFFPPAFSTGILSIFMEFHGFSTEIHVMLKTFFKHLFHRFSD